MKLLFSALAVASLGFAAPAMAEAPQGARAEVQLGADRPSYDAGVFGLGTYSKTGFSYGVVAGYDLPITNALAAGVDAGVSGSTAKYDLGGATLSVGRDIYVGGRLTGALSENVNLYGLVGYTNGKLKLSAPGASVSDTGDGVRFGVGGQYNVGKAFISAQYDHSNYEGEFSRNRFVVGAGYRF